jgi:hypothetical protein
LIDINKLDACLETIEFPNDWPEVARKFPQTWTGQTSWMSVLFKAFVGETLEAMRLACVAGGRRDSQVSEDIAADFVLTDDEVADLPVRETDAPEPEPADEPAGERALEETVVGVKTARDEATKKLLLKMQKDIDELTEKVAGQDEEIAYYKGFLGHCTRKDFLNDSVIEKLEKALKVAVHEAKTSRAFIQYSYEHAKVFVKICHEGNRILPYDASTATCESVFADFDPSIFKDEDADENSEDDDEDTAEEDDEEDDEQ